MVNCPPYHGRAVMGSVTLTLDLKKHVCACSGLTPLCFETLDPPRDFQCRWKSMCSHGAFAQSLRVREHVASFANASFPEGATCFVVSVFGISGNAMDGYCVHGQISLWMRRSWLGEFGSQAQRSGVDCLSWPILRLRPCHASPRAHCRVLEVLMMFAVQAWSSRESAWGRDAS